MSLSSSLPTLLLVGHSHICHLFDFCLECNLVNFGLSSYFLADGFALFGASLQDLPGIFEDIINHSPHIIIFDFGALDLLDRFHHLLTLTLTFRAFLGHLYSVQDSPLLLSSFSNTCGFGPLMGACLLMFLVAEFLDVIYFFYHQASCSSFFFFLGLLHLNQAFWPAELA